MTVSNPLRITADEVNCLIYSYFQDSGLKHSAFTILNEGRIQNSPYLARHIPRGELIDLLGKALLYLEVESHWRPDAVTNNCKSGFSLLEPHVCSSESVSSKPPVVSLPPATSAAPHSSSAKSQLQAPSSNRQPLPQSSSQASNPLPRVSTGPPESASAASKTLPSTATHDPESTPPATVPPAPSESGGKRKSSPVPVDGPQEKRQKTEPPSREMPSVSLSAAAAKRPKSHKNRPQGPGDDITDPRAIRLMPGHSTEVFVCAWNPHWPHLLATGAKDSEVILWDLAKQAKGANEFITDGRIHGTLGKLSQEVQGDLTSLHWSSDGQLLAIGSYDSVLRVATRTNLIWMTADLHEVSDALLRLKDDMMNLSPPFFEKGPIFAARFAKKGHMLLTASLDGTACVWDVSEKKLHRHFRLHKDCCLDVDWIDEKIFASAGADKRILLMHINQSEPLKVFEGHEDEINQIRTNSNGTRLASCSDDSTARIWRTDDLSSTDAIPGLSSSDNVIILKGHGHSVSGVAWCPPTNLHKGHEILATSVFFELSLGECVT
ncbi:hypothetical protein H1R20_g2775, partial [Candolleomyces eurysporus]